MKHLNLIRVALAAAVAALAIAAIPALAGAKDHGRDDRGRDDHGHHLRGDDGRRDDNGHHRGRHHNRHIDHFRGEATGTITAFNASTGKLTIAATNGDTVTGIVDRSTEIKCEGVDDRFTRARRDHGGDDNGGQSNSGPGRGGQTEPGDDNGGRGEPEPGDDHGEDNFPQEEGGEEMANCGVASLVTGAVVQEADVVIRGGASFFDEIELAHTS